MFTIEMADYRLFTWQPMDEIYTKTDITKKEDKRNHVCLALNHVWSFLEKYLPLANTHGADFISHRQWETFVPESCQHELLAMSRQDLVNLPSYHTNSSSVSCMMSDHRVNSTCTTRKLENNNTGDWLSSFIAGAYACHLDNLSTLSTMLDVVNSSGVLQSVEESSDGSDVISEAMSEKKTHEIEAISGIINALFRFCKADVVIDVGSGKGYLGSELVHHHKLPVLGLDSSHTNTQGALERDGKLARKWKGLTRRKERKKNSQNTDKQDYSNSSEQVTSHLTDCWNASKQVTNLEYNKTDGFMHKQEPQLSLQSVYIERISHPQHQFLCGCENSSLGRDLISSYGEGNTAGSEMQVLYQDSKLDVSRTSIGSSHVAACVMTSAASDASCFVETCPTERNINVPDGGHRKGCGLNQDELQTTETFSDRVLFDVAQNVPVDSSSGEVEGSKDCRVCDELKAPGLTQLYVPVTLAVHPDMNLHQTLADYAGCISLKSTSDANILLTGLHTCGSLSVTLMRLFLKDPGVVGLCYVGCCYQQMEESSGGGESSTHFPLSQFGKEQNLHLGRNARNLASQSVARIQASGQLQGADFCWRAILNVLLQDLGVPVPERIVGMRGLQKRSRTFQEYAQAALGKLQLNPDLITAELVASLQEHDKNIEKKMSAFFQLKLILAPVIETLVLLDRYLYLLEQDSVQDAHIVRLFDPVTSPRCYAVIAWKTKN